MKNWDLFHYLRANAAQNEGIKEGLPPVIKDPHTVKFLEEGHVMEYYFFEGKTKRVSWFWGPGEFIIRSSCFSQIETMDDVKLNGFTPSVIFQTLRSFKETHLHYQKIREQHHSNIRQRISDLKRLSAAEQFAKLLETKPWVFELGKEEDIASYLGITVSDLRVFRNNKI